MTELARIPAIGLPLARVRGEGVVVDPTTELVVESFPRCASSFALAAINVAQEPRRLRVAHHTHTPANALRAIRLRIPTLVLIRGPENVAVSNMIRHPGRTPNDVLRGFLRFYEPLLRHRHDLAVGTFEEVVGGDMGLITRRLNARFGTTFEEFEASEGNVARCLREIDEDWRRRRGGGERLERIVPRPSDVRDRLKAEQRERFRSGASPELLRRAGRVYAALVRSEAGATGPGATGPSG